ncbi:MULTISPECIES: Fic family protein [Acidobacterium]|uniref:Fic family protein n=1 Tax=Acidobacterium capsulatum (strain ATCC 51196 / DSM 11244 / BCRC 80197 / JCM 7670 / NBRC 15755 / NCIMB 13165 / 161) TaxID=240015 RepID=C1F5W7_ACIC5|nr:MULTISPECIES: Fic family protein [Acidobacterium]ACO33575.1 Fic family protein [Acidobacterium capsulatum ATCC 51196]HCT60792.1 cell filamentation protein Fic [Acidobacterium sp.]
MKPPDARHSQAEDARLLTDQNELARQEALNGLRQFDAVVEMVEYHLQPEHRFRFRPSHLLHLHRLALEGISSYAGTWRPASIQIEGSRHQPAGAHRVPELIEELCDYVNDHWQECTPIHLAAYVMWRLNWIHPFTDGNGRTSRAASYLIPCLRAGYLLPGKQTIPDQISQNKKPYYEALEAADAAWSERGTVDLSAMENLLAELLARQLVEVLDHATGGHVTLPSAKENPSS